MTIAPQSLLFVPGSRPERFAKAVASGADLICIDLEDAVAADAKETARAAALAAMGDPRLAIRINACTSSLGAADLAAICAAVVKPGVVLVPMVENAAALADATAQCVAAGINLMPLIETPKGLRLAYEIGATPGVIGLMFGGADFAAEIGCDLAWEPLRVARGLLLIAAAEAGVQAIDVPWIRLDDPAGLRAECLQAKALGFAGKAAIHPDQIATIHGVFRPTTAQIAEAEAAEAAFAAAGGAAVRFNGKMLEAPVVKRYRQTLALKDKIDA